jgi:hypothetical protein
MVCWLCHTTLKALGLVPPLMNCEMGCQCFHPIEGGESRNSFDSQPAYFSSIMGEIIASTHVGLYIRHQPNDEEIVKRYSKRCAHSTRQRIDPVTGATWMTQSLCRARLWNYLCSITTQSWPRKARDDFSIRYSHFSSSFLSITNKLPQPLCKSLNALYAAGQTYSGMVGATISFSIISRPLHNALWVPALVEDRFNIQDEDEPIIHCPILDIQSRSQAFACITHLDSGTLALNPKDFDDTLAVCSEDSIYVTSVLLSDPAENCRSKLHTPPCREHRPLRRLPARSSYESQDTTPEVRLQYRYTCTVRSEKGRQFPGHGRSIFLSPTGLCR